MKEVNIINLMTVVQKQNQFSRSFRIYGRILNMPSIARIFVYESVEQ
jgi:hypothetical protein